MIIDKLCNQCVNRFEIVVADSADAKKQHAEGYTCPYCGAKQMDDVSFERHAAESARIADKL